MTCEGPSVRGNPTVAEPPETIDEPSGLPAASKIEKSVPSTSGEVVMIT